MVLTQDWTFEKWRQVEQSYFKERPRIETHLKLKRLLDILLASIGIFVIFPILVTIAIAVRLDSPGSILFIQERLGKHGQPFYIYKFRTMVDGAVNIGAGLDTFKGDPRVTTVGKILREYHLDELPQLFNVVRGEMSLVGPRPLLMSALPTYTDWEKRRLLLPPGITGWEAVQGGLLNDVDDRIRLDIWYVDYFSLKLDFEILLRTIPVVLRKEGIYGENGSERGRGA